MPQQFHHDRMDYSAVERDMLAADPDDLAALAARAAACGLKPPRPDLTARQCREAMDDINRRGKRL